MTSTEHYHEYDAKGRQTLSEHCNYGKSHFCQINVTEYIGDTLKREYKLIQRFCPQSLTRKGAEMYLQKQRNGEEILELQDETFYCSGGKVRQTKYYNKGQRTNVVEHSYDEQGRLAKKTWVNDLDQHCGKEMVYRNNGRIIEEWVMMDSTKWLHQEATFNERGQITEMKRHCAPDDIIPLGYPRVRINKYTYNAEGLLIMFESDRDVHQQIYFKD